MGLRTRLKRAMPGTLYARGLLIVLLPLVLTQLLLMYIFYERHWDSVVRNLSQATVADISLLVSEYDRLAPTEGETQALAQVTRIGSQLGMQMHFDVGKKPSAISDSAAKRFPEFIAKLNETIHRPFSVKVRDDQIQVSVALNSGRMRVFFSHKRLASTTTYIFILWMIATSVLLGTIASLFLRNQIRPIVQLARAAEQFGLGQDVENFSPRGASEVRRAGRAFLVMAERIRRQLQTRTDMLSGISHDLRTPLTRMRLELEMSAIEPKTRQAMLGDIEEMRHMIDEYLDFARTEGEGSAEVSDVSQLLAEIANNYQRQHRLVHYLTPEIAVPWVGRAPAIRRCLQNLIDNALRYGKQAEISLELSAGYVRIKVADSGPGIPEASHATVFKPFQRLEASRNSKTGGVGLGLSIARDIAQSHGGDITLENRRNDAGDIVGLNAVVRLPRELVA
jgi:two-component system osmolarity sensor histidine kinase EnvZ